ncbi:FMN-binding split barrel-like protein [Penicillium sp. IBT 16267x]|nr:FMN-binding split barrel-like protein [Penicillium sp. IBT 16267x]KAJ6105085.1 FMN-binding split barrel-like protein [Penicillium sp. IBT 16267x]
MVSRILGLLALCTIPLTQASAIPPNPQAILAQNEAPNRLGEIEAETFTRPTWFTSTLMARRLLAKSSSGVISTIFPSPPPPSSRSPHNVAGLPIGLREYVSDCNTALPERLSNTDNGDPTILALRVATTFKNIGAGSKNFSLELDWWDHLDQAGPVYPGLPLSPAALPRVTLFGYLDTLPGLEGAEELEECFLNSHPDARVWLPGAAGSPHSSFWARMVVTAVYWIGGFGDVQQIGWMDVEEWKGVGQFESSVGDGRGWEDVRLPGERSEP